MTNQEAFTGMVHHLRKQMTQAADYQGRCKYRLCGPGGRVLKCAVGCLIPDDLYRPEFDNGYTLIDIRQEVPELAGVSQTLLHDMQAVHDIHEPPQWEAKWKSIAHRYGLEMPS